MANEAKVPYVTSPGYVTKVLEKIQTAPVPARFTQDFLETKLAIKSATARPTIPFLKRIGLLGSDGTPTELYRRFRNADERGAVAALALKRGYAPLYEVNEYVHAVDEAQLKNIVIQVTELEAGSRQIDMISASFKALRSFAKFDEELPDAPSVAGHDASTPSAKGEIGAPTGRQHDLRLGYTITLNLPATSDVAVFNAIFRSLRENLLD